MKNSGPLGIFLRSRASIEGVRSNFSKSQGLRGNSEFFQVPGIWRKYEELWRKYEEIMKKDKEKGKNYEGIMKKYEEIYGK